MVCEGLIQLFHVQMTVADQFAGQQQHRDFMAIAPTRRGIRIHVDDIHGDVGRLRPSREFREHFLAEPAFGAGIQQESQWEGKSLPPEDFTEWAMNSTVWAGTSPTAVT